MAQSTLTASWPAARRRIPILAATAALVAAAMLALVLLDGRETTPDAAESGAPAGAVEVRVMLEGLPQDGAALGEPGAPVTLIEFADMQCPYCRDFALQTLPLIVRDYVRTGKVRLEFRPLAFIGPDSERAARILAGAAASDRLWHVAHLFYFNQGAENTGYATDAFLDGLVRTAVPGADPDAIRRAGSTAAADDLLNDAAALAQRHGIDSTPSFLLGRTAGERREVIAGVPDHEALRARLDALAAR